MLFSLSTLYVHLRHIFACICQVQKGVEDNSVSYTIHSMRGGFLFAQVLERACGSSCAWMVL